MDFMTSAAEIERYGRQLIMPEIGPGGQARLKAARVLIVGAGGLGCPAALYLTAAGVGHVTIADGDTVELSNLHRQILHTISGIGTPKATSAITALRKLNDEVIFEAVTDRISNFNVRSLVSQHSLVLDCTDNIESRYMLSDACVNAVVPLVSAGALKTEGHLTTYNLSGGPCYRCMYPSPPPRTAVTSCSEGGILGVVTGILGSMQALEAIKIIVGKPLGMTLRSKLLMFDAVRYK